MDTPFLWEVYVDDTELAQIGTLALRWSHIEHILANCLRRLVRMSEEDATLIIFPMTLEKIVQTIDNVVKARPLKGKAKMYYDELRPTLEPFRYVRNTMIHSILTDNSWGQARTFHLRSKLRDLSIEEVLSTGDFTNYVATLVIDFRKTLGHKLGKPGPLPDKPALPGFLIRAFPGLRQKGWVALKHLPLA